MKGRVGVHWEGAAVELQSLLEWGLGVGVRGSLREGLELRIERGGEGAGPGLGSRSAGEGRDTPQICSRGQRLFGKARTISLEFGGSARAGVGRTGDGCSRGAG